MPVYRKSSVEAIQRREAHIWELSYSYKVACTHFLSQLIKNKHTKNDALQKAVDIFGQLTVAYVLANSVNYCDEKRVVPYLKDWAKRRKYHVWTVVGKMIMVLFWRISMINW